MPVGCEVDLREAAVSAGHPVPYRIETFGLVFRPSLDGIPELMPSFKPIMLLPWRFHLETKTDDQGRDPGHLVGPCSIQS